MNKARSLALILGAALVFSWFANSVWKRHSFFSEYDDVMGSGFQNSAYVDSNEYGVVFFDSDCGEEILLDLVGPIRDGLKDTDGDGLSLSEEIVRLTSDCNIDSDSDGLLDPIDPFPNCYSDSTTPEIWAAVLREHSALVQSKLGSDPAIVVIESTFSCLGISDPETENTQFVTVRFGMTPVKFIKRYTDRFVVRPLVFSPGGRFSVEVAYSCGPGCGVTAIYSGFDIPGVRGLLMNEIVY